MIVTATAVVSALGFAGALEPRNDFLAFVPIGPAYNVVNLTFALTPIAVFMHVYQRHSLKPFRFWEIPAAAMVFTLYTYVWIFATARALVRAATGRHNWVKTPRVAEQPRHTDGDPALAPVASG